MKSIAIILVFLSTINCAKELIVTHMVYRHGHRSPERFFDWDINDKSLWDEFGGAGQLTTLGKLREYEIGELIRNRYISADGFIGDDYNPNTVFIRSSGADRCLMSAQLQVASTFIPNDEQKWKNDLDWQPIPIQTVPSNIDYLLRTYVAPCPKLSEYDTAAKNGEEMLNLTEEYKELIEYINEKTGTEWEITELFRIDDLFKIELENNLTLVDWATENIVEELDIATFKQFKIQFMQNNTEYRKLFGGFLLNEMAKRMEIYVQNEKNGKQQNSIVFDSNGPVDLKKKMILYSAHDMTLAAITNTLGIPYLKRFSYGTILSLDLIRDTETNEFLIETYLNYERNFEKVELELCPSPCTLDKFLEVFDDVRMENIISSCHFDIDFVDKKANDYKLALVIAVPILITALICSLGAMIYYIQKK